MEQKKTNKKKLVVALALLALIVVASVITTVVLVLAANQQNVQSNVTVTYSVTDVSATVTGRYGKKVTSGDVLVNKMSPESITFTAEQETQTSAMSPETVVLNSTNNYAVFEYKFQNNATANPFTINLTYTDDYNSSTNAGTQDKNIAVGFISSDNEISNFDVYTRATKGTSPTAASWASGWETSFTQTQCNDVKYVYVVVAVADLDQAAHFSGAFAFTLASTVQA